jgi:hypothetical protein
MNSKCDILSSSMLKKEANHSMKTDSKLLRFIFTSPWLLLLFLIIPLLVVLSVSFHIHLPFANSKYPLLFNNACFSLLIAFRFFYYLLGMTKAIRYGAGKGVPRQSLEIALPVATVRCSLAGYNYAFDTVGNYGEKREHGYTGTMIIYAGLCIVFITGTLDNMYQFSGTLQDGIGVATDLKKMEAYKRVSIGPIAANLATLPKMKIVRQYFPNATYPRGATEVAFQFPDGKEQQVILKSPDPFRAGAYDIYMSKMVYEPRIVVTLDDSMPVYNGQVTLDQLVTKENGYGFYGTFAEGLLDGKVYYQPEKSLLRVILHQGNQQLLDTELFFQVDRLSRSANFAIRCERMGVWSEIYVVHRRHLPLILLGGILAAIGLLMRLYFRPQRVWLEETLDGCRVRWVGKEAEKLLKVEG